MRCLSVKGDGGLGIRSQVDVAPAAWISSILSTFRSTIYGDCNFSKQMIHKFIASPANTSEFYTSVEYFKSCFPSTTIDVSVLADPERFEAFILDLFNIS